MLEIALGTACVKIGILGISSRMNYLTLYFQEYLIYAFEQAL